jgi:hypothetical protein
MIDLNRMTHVLRYAESEPDKTHAVVWEIPSKLGTGWDLKLAVDKDAALSEAAKLVASGEAEYESISIISIK